MAFQISDACVACGACEGQCPVGAISMGDGKFELLLVPLPKNLADLQGLLDAAVRQNFASPHLIFRHVCHVTVQTKEDLPWSLDGEYAPSVPEVHIDNLHGALDLFV